MRVGRRKAKLFWAVRFSKAEKRVEGRRDQSILWGVEVEDEMGGDIVILGRDGIL